jgi:hypothetical protein
MSLLARYKTLVVSHRIPGHSNGAIMGLWEVVKANVDANAVCVPYFIVLDENTVLVVMAVEWGDHSLCFVDGPRVKTLPFPREKQVTLLKKMRERQVFCDSLLFGWPVELSERERKFVEMCKSWH